jgi:hypothetical protein
MKKTIGTVGVIVLLAGGQQLSAQNNWEAQKNPTVDSITAKYKDKMVTAPAPKTTDLIFPAIGVYESGTNTGISNVSISQDETNKGLIWVEGLPQGRIKGLLTRSPATYKIPAQQNEAGKAVAEGTLIYDRETNTLSICIGKPFNSANPALVFTETIPAAEPLPVKGKKSKSIAVAKAWFYTGTKMEKSTAGN